MSRFFTNSEYQTCFEKHGFVKLPNFSLQEQDIAELLNIKEKYRAFDLRIQKDKGFYVGVDHPDKQMVKNITQEVNQILMPRIKPFIDDYYPFITSFIIKRQDPDAELQPHQDWTFIEDEMNNNAVTCWIPLQDVNQNNGCLGIIRGSHKFFKNPRTSPPSACKQSVLYEHATTILPYFEWIPMKAGEVLFFDYRVIHASLPNTLLSDRVAVGMWFAHKNAEFRHYYFKPDKSDRLLKYKVDADFYLKYDVQRLSELYNNGRLIEDYELLEEVEFNPEKISKNELIRLMKEAGNMPKNLPDSIKGRISFGERLLRYLHDLFSAGE